MSALNSALRGGGTADLAEYGDVRFGTIESRKALPKEEQDVCRPLSFLNNVNEQVQYNIRSLYNNLIYNIEL